MTINKFTYVVLIGTVSATSRCEFVALCETRSSISSTSGMNMISTESGVLALNATETVALRVVDDNDDRVEDK